MWRIAIVSFTEQGCEQNVRLCRELPEALRNAGHWEETFVCTGYAPARFCGDFPLRAVAPSLFAWTEKMFHEADALFFLSAVGIAVRSIAPYVRDKKTDPAVAAADERGRFVISLLSGHAGGANLLTKAAARVLGAVPVITTATDVNGVFAVDVFARRNHCRIREPELVKRVSASLLEGKQVGFVCDFPVQGELPEGLTGDGELPLGIRVSLSDKEGPFPETLHLVPRIVTAGIGCRRGIPAGTLERVLTRALFEAGISREAVAGFASIERKKDEKGILELAEQYGVPFRVYSREELLAVPGTFTASAFVQQTAGVENVCERSALCAGGRLLARKRAEDGVTIALAAADWRAQF